MSDEPKFTISRDAAVVGAFTKWDLMKSYNSRAACADLWVEIEGAKQSLWSAIERWHGGRKWEEAVVDPSKLRKVPVLKTRANEGENKP